MADAAATRLLQRWIAPWENAGTLRPWAAVRITSGVVSAGLGVYVTAETWPGPWAIFGGYLIA